KKLAKTTMPSSTEAVLAPVTVRIRKIPSGISGAAALVSRTTNATSRAAAPISDTIVDVAPQPCVGASAIPYTRSASPPVTVAAPRGWGGGAARAEFPPPRGAAVSTEDRARAREHRRTDGDVDEEDPLPAEIAGEDAAEEHAGGRAASGHRAPDAERPISLRAFL